MSELLTLAIPVFNGERFLADTLSSLNANGSSLRWRLQDGGSQDRTLEIARAHAREGDAIISEADKGQADALNRAFMDMGGKIIGFINADDVLVPDAAARVLDFFGAHPDVDLAYGEVEWIDEVGEVTGRHAGRIESLEQVLDLYGVWWSGRQWVQPEVFFRRGLWERVGFFDTRYHLAFDYDFWVRCFLAGARVARIPHTLARFRLHAAQKSSASERAAGELRDIVAKHLAASPPGISAAKRRTISAELSYDLYQSGKSAGPSRPAFFPALLSHPEWLLARAARKRMGAACKRLIRGK